MVMLVFTLLERVKQNRRRFLLGLKIKQNKETLKRIDESLKRLVELAEQQRSDRIEDAKRQKKWNYIKTALAIIAIIVALLKK